MIYSVVGWGFVLSIVLFVLSAWMPVLLLPAAICIAPFCIAAVIALIFQLISLGDEIRGPRDRRG